MKTLQQFILEKLKISKSDEKTKQILTPSSTTELINIIKERYKESPEFLDLTNVDVSDIGNMNMIFKDLKSVEKIDITGWDTRHADSMGMMFSGCTNLKEIIGIDELDMYNITNISNMFAMCSSLESLDLSSWRLQNLQYANMMFYSCHSLKEIKGIEKWSTPNLVTVEKMFEYCDVIEHIDLSGWDAKILKHSKYMFNNCRNLKSVDVSGFAFTGVTGMFDRCTNLEKIVMKDIKVNAIHDASFMFNACRKLKTLEGDIENWNTEHLSLAENMFANCSELELDLSKWDISNLQVNTKMFYNAPGIKKPRRKKK